MAISRPRRCSWAKRPAGRVLDELLREAGLTRGAVYLTNVIKCRPPKNRVPHKDEIANCHPYLREQIALVRPRVICALGGVAACALARSKLPLERLRGVLHQYDGIPMVCSYHPAYVRRMPSLWAAAVADLRRVREQMNAT